MSEWGVFLVCLNLGLVLLIGSWVSELRALRRRDERWALEVFRRQRARDEAGQQRPALDRSLAGSMSRHPSGRGLS